MHRLCLKSMTLNRKSSSHSFISAHTHLPLPSPPIQKKKKKSIILQRKPAISAINLQEIWPRSTIWQPRLRFPPIMRGSCRGATPSSSLLLLPPLLRRLRLPLHLPPHHLPRHLPCLLTRLRLPPCLFLLPRLSPLFFLAFALAFFVFLLIFFLLIFPVFFLTSVSPSFSSSRCVAYKITFLVHILSFRFLFCYSLISSSFHFLHFFFFPFFLLFFIFSSSSFY